MKRIIERFKNCLFAPKKIAPYAFDKFGKVILYLLFWVLLISVPFIINIFTTPFFDYHYQGLIKEGFEKAEDVDAVIVDYQLQSAEEAPYIINIKDLSLSIIIDATFNTNEIKNEQDLQSVLILLAKEEILMLYQPTSGFHLISVPLAKYTDLKAENINNLDFSRANDRNDFAFWDQFFRTTENLVDLHIWKIQSSHIIITIVDSLLVLVTSILLISFLIKIFKNSFPITFKEIFKVVTYSYTPYALTLLLSVLYSISWLDDIGMIISVIYANIVTSELVRYKLTTK